MKYVCDICGYVYDPEVGDPDNGVAPGTPWEDVPEDWVCPLLGRQGPVQPGRISHNASRRESDFSPAFLRFFKREVDKKVDILPRAPAPNVDS